MRIHLALIALCALLVLAIGCRNDSGEKEYERQFFAASEDWQSVTQEIASRPLPETKGLTRDQKIEALAARMREDNSKIKKLADQFHILKPPSRYSTLHTTYQEFLDGQVRLGDEHAKALDVKDLKLARVKNDEYTRFLVSQLKKLLSEIEKAGGDVTDLRRNFEKTLLEASSGVESTK